MEPGPLTQDNKTTWVSKCEAGKVGGCKGPNYDQLQLLNQAIGRQYGASPQEPPLVISKTLGPLTCDWRTPGVVEKLELPSSDLIFRRR